MRELDTLRYEAGLRADQGRGIARNGDAMKTPSRRAIAANGVMLGEAAIPYGDHALRPGNAYLAFRRGKQVPDKIDNEIAFLHGNIEDAAFE